MTFIIGIIGKPGAGKDSLTKILTLMFEEMGHGVSSLVFSDILLSELGKKEATRKELQKKARDMEQEGIDRGDGPGALSRAMRKYINKIEGVDYIIVDGVRWLTDRDMVLSFENHLIIGIVADQDVRYGRLTQRGEKVGETTKTFAQFQEEDKAPTEVFIDQIIRESAGLIIDNNGILEDIKRQINRESICL